MMIWFVVLLLLRQLKFRTQNLFRNLYRSCQKLFLLSKTQINHPHRMNPAYIPKHIRKYRLPRLTNSFLFQTRIYNGLLLKQMKRNRVRDMMHIDLLPRPVLQHLNIPIPNHSDLWNLRRPQAQQRSKENRINHVPIITLNNHLNRNLPNKLPT